MSILYNWENIRLNKGARNAEGVNYVLCFSLQLMLQTFFVSDKLLAS